MSIPTITRQTARRYILGRHGLWPGRRWIGKAGTEQAVRQAEAVQVDPLNVVARNHDLVLAARVADYDPAHLDALMYQDRQFFDYGGILMIFPMAELPYWRPIMARRVQHRYWTDLAVQYAAAIEQVRAAIRERGPLGNRDFAGQERVQSYRARKDTGLALYYLWTVGELMIHSRLGIERRYHFATEIVPPGLDHAVSLEEAEHYFALKATREVALGTAGEWARRLRHIFFRQLSPKEVRAWLDRLTAAGEVVEVRVEGRKDVHYLPAADLPLLDTLAAGEIPPAWTPLGPTTDEEVTFLAPLDNVTWDRSRLLALFDFDYLWEVYVPAAKRRWGYYALPILWGDRLVGRLDPRLERKTNTLAILGFWLEDPALADDPAFAAALANGLARFAALHAARALDLTPLPAPLQATVRGRLSASTDLILAP